MPDTATADIEVEVPGTGVVSFPGDMSHEDIEKAIRTHPDFKADPNIPQLSEAPKKGVLTKIRESLSPLIGPTENQKLAESIPWGKDAQGNTIYKYRPAGGKIEQEGFVPALSHPMIPIPKAPPNPEDSTLKAAAKAVYNTGAGFAEFFESPVGMATGGIAGGATKLGDVASKVIPRVIAAGYGAQMGAQVPESAQRAGTLSVTGTPQEKMEADLGLAGNVVLPGFLASPSTVSRVTRLMPRTLAEVAKIGSDEQAIKPPRHPLLQGADAVEQAAKDVESAGKIPGQNAATALANARASIDAIGQQLQAAREAPATAAGRPAEVVQATQAAAQAVLNEAGEAVNRAGEQVKSAPNSPEAAELVKQAVSKLKHLAAQIAIFHGATEQQPTTEVQNASGKQETTAVHGDVQSQPVEGKGQVPVAQGGGGVQPRPDEAQATGPRPAAHDQTGLTPAVKIGDSLYAAAPDETGDHVHDLIEARLKKQGIDVTGAKRGFVGPNGFEDRTEAAATSGLPTTKEPGKLHSSDLINTPDSIMAMPDADLLKLTSETDEQGVRKFRVQEQGIKWGAQQPAEALQAIEAKAKGVQKDMLAAMQDPKRTAEVPALQQRAQYLASAAEGIRGANKLGGVTATYDDLVKKGMIKQPEAVGMGGAKLGEVAVQGNPDIHGVANRVREEMAKAGRAVPPVSGEGISAEKAVEWGRTLMDALQDKGITPEDLMREFERTKAVSFDAFAVARARGEQLAYIQTRIEENPQEGGTDSDAYRKAAKDSDDWQARIQKMKTEWHKTGQAMQGEVEIDTGTFTGLRRAFKDANPDKEMTPAQETQAKAVAKKSKTAQEVADAAQAKLNELLKKPGAIPDDVLQKAVWAKVKDYIDKGVDNFDDVRNKVATDLGISVNKVTKLISQNRAAKRLADDVWRKQQTARTIKEQAKRWAVGVGIPAWERWARSIPKIMFGAKVGFHGTVALGTHAPMVAFQPRFWNAYVRDFGKMYGMVFNKTFYERQVQDLTRSPNYTKANRAGLVNDPFTYEDYTSPDTVKYFGKLTGSGNRGYTVLKILRQDMFDQHWNRLPDSVKKAASDPAASEEAKAQAASLAKAIADGINHATGVVKGRAPKAANLTFFAPRLEASRVMWMAGDPLRAAKTGLKAFGHWDTATPEEKYFAINQVKEKAWVAGTFFSLLALNQGILSAVGSKQKINGVPTWMGGAGIDPMRSDFLKFKIDGMDVSYGNPMITMARLPIRLAVLRGKGGSGKLSKLIYPDESMVSEVGKYLRTQLSPFAGTLADFAFKGDYENRPLPKMPLSGAQLPMPKRLAARGEKPYTWTELGVDTVLPIPAEEAVRDVWKNGFGMSEAQIDGYLKAIAKASFMAATGARLTDDTQVPGK